MEKKRAEGEKILKRGKLGQGVGALKGEGAGTPLRTMSSQRVPLKKNINLFHLIRVMKVLFFEKRCKRSACNKKKI